MNELNLWWSYRRFVCGTVEEKLYDHRSVSRSGIDMRASCWILIFYEQKVELPHNRCYPARTAFSMGSSIDKRYELVPACTGSMHRIKCSHAQVAGDKKSLTTVFYLLDTIDCLDTNFDNWFKEFLYSLLDPLSKDSAPNKTDVRNQNRRYNFSVYHVSLA